MTLIAYDLDLFESYFCHIHTLQPYSLHTAGMQEMSTIIYACDVSVE